MSNFDKESINTVIEPIEEVMEDVIAAVVSDSIEVTVQSVLQDVVTMEFGYGQHIHLDTSTDNYIDNDRRMVAIIGQLVYARLCWCQYVVLHAARTARRRLQGGETPRTCRRTALTSRSFKTTSDRGLI
ncbi:unnamed protein product [Macrosiphum euphorbiae]|uniref:Uncharacterized protein n=1 Tax=Macrosiphum euphorbiae TaxID=13131 RepID=A0AAV0XM25_9HEMI|nr:unnamed protein product [Macrosiphum euphorbiae]